MGGSGRGVMAPGAVPAKDEGCAVTDQVVVKEEPEFPNEESECVKEEVEPSLLDSMDFSCGVSEAALLASLYTDHVVKDELVLGPESMHRPKIAFVSHESRGEFGLGARLVSRDCCVRLEPPAPREAHHSEPQAPQEHADNRQRARYTNTYVCDTCGKMYKRKYYLIRHINIYGSLNASKHIEMVEKPYACEICQKLYRNSCLLKAHKRAHSGEKIYSCEICQKKIARAESLKRHMLLHKGEKPHSCEICNKRFAELSNLVNHKRTHTRERPYSCEICKKDFGLLSTLITHKKPHTGLKPYFCKICDRQFTQSSTLKTHKRIHEVTSYPCDICKKQFIRLIHLKEHKRSHSEINPYSCDVSKQSKQPIILRHSFPNLFGLPLT